MAEPPKLTDEQRQAALEKAAEARKVRAEVKEQLKTGSLSLPGLFARAERDEMVGKLKVLALLEAMPGVGKVKARRTMDEIGIAETRRVQGLGAQQRAKLLELFARRIAVRVWTVIDAGRTRGPRTRQPQRRILLDESASDRALAGTAGARQHDRQRPSAHDRRDETGSSNGRLLDR